MPLWGAPAVVPVAVTTNGVNSQSMNFEFLPADESGAFAVKGPDRTVVVKK